MKMNKFDVFTHICAGVGMIISAPLIYNGITSALSSSNRIKKNISFREEDEEDEDDEFDIFDY